MSLTLGLDIGTQGTKAVLLHTHSGEVVGRASTSYGLIEGLPAGAAEQDPRTWRAAVAQVIGELLGASDREPRDVEAIGVAGQQHGCVVLDADFEPVRPAKLWCDTATAPEAAELSAALGRAVPTGFTASKLLWLARHEPANWTRTAHVLLPHDYINQLLTGELFMEAGDASGTGLFDCEARTFDSHALAIFDELAGLAGDPGLASRLPPLLDPSAPAAAHGVLSRAAALEFGLAPGTLVSAGGGDNMMGAIGSGATRPGILTMSLGTSGTAVAHADGPVADPEGLIAPFCGSTGGWLPLLCVMNCTGVTEEVRSCFGLDHGALTALARDVEPGCGGLLWLPYLNGERVPDLPTARGRLLGMGPGHLRPGPLYRAALEGTCLNLAWGVERLERLTVPARELRISGGGAQNRLILEILSACIGAPIQTLLEPEAASLGAAMQAAWCLAASRGEPDCLADLTDRCVRLGNEIIEPDPVLVTLYASLAQRFQKEVQALSLAPTVQPA